jgi:hypothetical protein
MLSGLAVRTKVLGVSFAIASALLPPTASSAQMNISVDYVRRSVVFLYGADAQGNVDPNKPLGTGFIIQIPRVSDPTQVWDILVTARHIADPHWANCGTVAPKIFMRVNKKNFDASKDAVGTADVPLEGHPVSGNTWSFSDDPDIDVASIPLDGKTMEPYDVDGAHVSDFPTPEEQKTFKAGDEIISAGLLQGASGKKRNYPIFKFGHISSIPDESVDSPACGPGPPSHALKVWFIAASLVPGNSGSPIYYVPPIFRSAKSNERPMLLGVQSVSFIPWDVAGMTPSQYLYEMIEKMKLSWFSLKWRSDVLR